MKAVCPGSQAGKRNPKQRTAMTVFKATVTVKVTATGLSHRFGSERHDFETFYFTFFVQAFW